MHKKMYLIYRVYDVDGGFGDAIEQRDCIGTIYATESECLEFINKNSKSVVVDKPYDNLYDGRLEAELLPSTIDMKKEIFTITENSEDEYHPFSVKLNKDIYES